MMVDTPPEGLSDSFWVNEFDYVLNPAGLYGENWSSWIFKHDIVEACTAVKGHALLHILSLGAEKVIYLDPDIALFHDLSEIERRLDKYSVVLTPHQVEPNLTESEVIDNEITSMKYGIYNLGFLAVRNDEDGKGMARWWASCLFRACYDDVPNGIFTDQKYCDHVPGLFGNVHVERDPGYNVASWNLSRRTLTICSSGRILVNHNSPLRFYHFTKINSEGDIMTDRYASGGLAVFEVWNWYKRAIAAAELPGIPTKYWRYGRFDDNTPIPKSARVLYRNSSDLQAQFTHPFQVSERSYLHWLRSEKPEVFAHTNV
ncbi:hypothetical protein MKK68_25335 [Methylobacterium sp. E-016]|uniref:hypothetical protein n=1 Tax=Methylobacterium sp. E-016 TaxID=2836556 RepID=UPI001FBADAD5|nr:hypothetical protein [Methylobacterium sp. E-016]MCJ2078919.1 hypothetical protein [Methylobacterium sp. E-016]